MTDKLKLVILCSIVSFIIGRGSKHEKVITKTEEKIVYKESEAKLEKRNIKTTKKPDGTIEILDSSTLESLLAREVVATKKDEKIVDNSSNVLVQGLTMYRDNGLVYGGAVSKQLIGPLTLGVFGFTDLKFGVSVGFEL